MSVTDKYFYQPYFPTYREIPFPERPKGFLKSLFNKEKSLNYQELCMIFLEIFSIWKILVGKTEAERDAERMNTGNSDVSKTTSQVNDAKGVMLEAKQKLEGEKFS